MLRTVFARAHSDKNGFLLTQIRSLISSSHRKVMLIVPEQSSFETEKEVYNMLGDREYTRVEVLSFKRLCNLISSRFGASNGKKLSSAGKMVLSSLAVENALPSLKVYKGQGSSRAFSEKISSVIDELKIASVTPKKLLETAAEIDSNLFMKDKLEDVAVIYEWYDSFLDQGYLDPSDELTSALNKLGDGEFFKDYDVIIDEFASFNGAQLEFIGKMLQNSPSVTVFLCSSFFKTERIPAPFKTPNDTFMYLKQRALLVGAKIDEPIELPLKNEEVPKDIIALEKFAANEKCDNISGDSVSVRSFKSVKAECRWVAAEICRLIRECGYRYKDFAVIGREMKEYQFCLEDSMRLYGIPFFADMRATLDTRPIVIFIVSLLETIINDFDPLHFISYLKCPISPINNDDAVKLENYIDLWKLNKTKILKPFEQNPSGIKGEWTENDTKNLNELEEIRKKAVAPLVTLKKEITGSNGDKITRAIYSFMQKNGVLDNLSKYTMQISQNDISLAKEGHRAFEACMEVMSQLSFLLLSANVTPKRYLELFTLALAAEDVGSIPHHLDELMIGDAGRIRAGKVKVAFVVGLNEGSFPKRHTEDGFFTDKDRNIARQAGLDILTPSKLLNQNEHYYLYNALTCASDRVYLSYSKTSGEGEETFASKVITTIEDKLQKGIVDDLKINPKDLLLSEEAAFEMLCMQYNENTPLANALREYFMRIGKESYRQRILQIDKGLRNRTSKIDPAVSEKLYGRDLMVSPTQVDTYHYCQFKHFCKYGLALATKKSTDLEYSDSGNAVHSVLEQMLSMYTKNEISAFGDDELSKVIERCLKAFLEKEMGGVGEENRRIKYGIMRLKSTVMPVIKFITKELDSSGFTPQNFELPIKDESRVEDASEPFVEPYRIVSEKGVNIGIHGKVDRVDIKKSDDVTYVRIVDYKCGNKVFDRNEIEYGLGLQMFLYLFSIWENGDKLYGKNITPSGVLYMPAKRPNNKLSGAGEKVKDDSIPPIKMKGMVISDEAVADKETRKKFYNRNSSVDEFTDVKNQIVQVLSKMADDISLGELSINPLYKNEKNAACDNCDFKMICGYEEGDEHRTMQTGEEED